MSFLSQAFQSQSANNTSSIVSPENSTKIPLGGQNEFFQGTFVPSANYSVVQLSCLSNTLVEIIVESSFDGIAYTVTNAFFNTQEDIDTTRAAPFYAFITLPYVRILIQNIDTITNTIFEFCTKLTSTSPPANQIDPAPVIIIGTAQVQDILAEASLASIDGKIINCDTSAVIVSSGNITETNSAAIAASLVSINDNITSTLNPTGLGGNVVGSFIWAYNAAIGSLSGLQADAALNLKVVEKNSDDILTAVASIDSKIVTCDTSAVVVSSGNINIDNFPAVQLVSGENSNFTFYPSAANNTVAIYADGTQGVNVTGGWQYANLATGKINWYIYQSATPASDYKVSDLTSMYTVINQQSTLGLELAQNPWMMIYTRPDSGVNSAVWHKSKLFFGSNAYTDILGIKLLYTGTDPIGIHPEITGINRIQLQFNSALSNGKQLVDVQNESVMFGTLQTTNNTAVVDSFSFTMQEFGIDWLKEPAVLPIEFGKVQVQDILAEASLASIDSKIIACDTGAVFVSSGNITETNSGDIAASLATIDGKIISCDTSDVTITNPLPAGSNEIGSVVLRAYNVTAATYLDLLISDTQNLKVVEENSADILTAINSIDGKIINCDTSAVVVSSGSITETNSAAIAASVASIDGHIIGCNTDAVIVASGSITETNSAAIAASVASIDGHIIGCNTDAVIVASGSITETNSAAIAASVASIDGHIIGCNTDAVIIASGSITETNSAAIAASVASIDGHIIGCNTDAVIVASGSITETNSAAIAASVASIDGHIIGCNTDAVTISTALPSGSNIIGAVNLRAYNNGIPGEILLNSKTSSESNNCLCVTDLAADKLEINANTPSYVENIAGNFFPAGSGLGVDMGLGEYRYRNASVMLNVTTVTYPNPAVMFSFSEDNVTFYFDGILASFYSLGGNTKSCVLQRTQVPSRYVKVYFLNDTDVIDGIITLQKS